MKFILWRFMQPASRARLRVYPQLVPASNTLRSWLTCFQSYSSHGYIQRPICILSGEGDDLAERPQGFQDYSMTFCHNWCIIHRRYTCLLPSAAAVASAPCHLLIGSFYVWILLSFLSIIYISSYSLSPALRPVAYQQ